MYGVRSLGNETVAPVCWPVSNAHSFTAAVIWRMLLMQAFCCEVVRAFTKLGIAMAAKRPMMATTIMISTSVKPDLRDALIFILLFRSFCFAVRARQQAGYLVSAVRSLTVLPVATADLEFSTCN